MRQAAGVTARRDNCYYCYYYYYRYYYSNAVPRTATLAIESTDAQAIEGRPGLPADRRGGGSDETNGGHPSLSFRGDKVREDGQRGA